MSPLDHEFRERAIARAQWKVMKWHNTPDLLAGKAPDEEDNWSLNILLNEGITRLMNLLAGLGGTDFGNASAYLGIGDAGTPSALTGTLTFTNGSAAVSATGGAFTTEVAAGDIVRLDADDAWGEVLSVTDNNNLTLTANYAAAGGAGAASKLAKAVATQTGLQGTNKIYKAVDATYPQISGQTMTWQATFADGEAVFAWREGTVANGNSDAAENLNRKVMGLGTKGATGTWVLQLQITWS